MRNALRIARLIAHKLITDMRTAPVENVTTYRATGLPKWMDDNRAAHAVWAERLRLECMALSHPNYVPSDMSAVALDRI